jgi:hypothetical protein
MIEALELKGSENRDRMYAVQIGGPNWGGSLCTLAASGLVEYNKWLHYVTDDPEWGDFIIIPPQQPTGVMRVSKSEMGDMFILPSSYRNDWEPLLERAPAKPLTQPPALKPVIYCAPQGFAGDYALPHYVSADAHLWTKWLPDADVDGELDMDATILRRMRQHGIGEKTTGLSILDLEHPWTSRIMAAGESVYQSQLGQYERAMELWNKHLPNATNGLYMIPTRSYWQMDNHWLCRNITVVHELMKRPSCAMQAMFIPVYDFYSGNEKMDADRHGKYVITARMLANHYNVPLYLYVMQRYHNSNDLIPRDEYMNLLSNMLMKAGYDQMQETGVIMFPTWWERTYPQAHMASFCDNTLTAFKKADSALRQLDSLGYGLVATTVDVAWRKRVAEYISKITGRDYVLAS